MVLSLVMLITGFSLGDLAEELISWIDNYVDYGNKGDVRDITEADQHLNDIMLHMAIATLTYFLFFSMTVGGYIWAWVFLDIKDAGDDFECEIKPQDYSALPGIVANINSKATCLENIDKLFDIADLNGDNYISRCEDANFQAAQGQDEDFARKFSTAFTRDYVRIVCDGQFRF